MYIYIYIYININMTKITRDQKSTCRSTKNFISFNFNKAKFMLN